MNLYLISQDKNNEYDTYDAAVVTAENEDKAKKMCPCGRGEVKEKYSRSNDDWLTKEHWTTLGNVSVSLIGKAKAGQMAGVILASFHAG